MGREEGGTLATEADYAACRALLRDGSRSFYAASFLLPARVRRAATALYAFCRVADDAMDLQGGDATTLRELAERVAGAHAGDPAPLPFDRALSATVAAHCVPQALLDALLEGLAWDASGRRYEELEDVLDYAARVAGTVGVMMSLLMGARSATALARACDLGMAMQLSNIARDVGEDARAGRLYLPRRWLREAGIDPDVWLAAPRHSPELARVVARLLDVAERLYQRAREGIVELPLACRPGMQAARLLYREIGLEVRRRGCDAVSGRAVVPGWRKLLRLGTALVTSPWAGQVGAMPVERAGRFLVEAALLAGPGEGVVEGGFDAGVASLVRIFERLEHMQRARAEAALRAHEAARRRQCGRDAP